MARGTKKSECNRDTRQCLEWVQDRSFSVSFNTEAKAEGKKGEKTGHEHTVLL